MRFEEGTFYLLYGERRLPIAPGTYRYVLEIALQNLAEYKDEEFYAELQSILTALEYLPKRTETDPERIAERTREKEIIKRRLERRCAEAPQVQKAIEKALAQINGKPGDPRSFDTLDELLNAQSYRLAFWRVAAEEINYRRFFDVNESGGDSGRIARGLRRHSPASSGFGEHWRSDGLAHRSSRWSLFAGGVFRKTSAALRESARDRAARKTGARFTWWSEKILTGSETLRKDWRVHGTTGYDFANQVMQLLVDSSAETAITKTFHRFIGHSVHFGHLLYAKKLQVMKLALANDVDVLGQHARSAFGAKPLVSRFHARGALARGARNHRLLSLFIEPISRRSAGERGRSSSRRARDQRQPNAETRRWTNRSSIFCGTSCSFVFRKI